MDTAPLDPPLTRGHRKRARTRQQLIDAGLDALADRGDAMTVTDVVSRAEVSNGTFYNYFDDADELVLALAEHVAVRLADDAAAEPIDDPAARFAHATAKVLIAAHDDTTWGRAVLRLVGRPDVGTDVVRHARADVAEGHRRGRFTVPADDATMDLVAGLVVMSIRRIVDGGGPDVATTAVARGLVALGVPEPEATELATGAVAAEVAGSSTD